MTALVTHKILTIEENILNIATEIVNDYSHKRHVDTTGDVFNLLDRNVIFDCIRDLISIIYPGYYKTNDYKIYNLGTSVSLLLENILYHLSRQIAIALNEDENNHGISPELIQENSYNIALHFLEKIPEIRSKINDDIENKIILFFKKCIRSFCSNTYGSTIEKIFVLITKISKSYNQYAPGILKCLVALFIEMYDDIIRREIFLINFENFLNEQKQVPLDIFFDPYINKIKTSNGYNLCDFNFLLKIIDHPRLGVKDIINIINFLLNVSIKKNVFNRCAIFVMEKILTELYQNLKDQEEIKSISTLLISHINQVLDICLLNENEDINNEFLLEMSYIIIQHNIEDVKQSVKDKILEFAKKYFNKYGEHSEICLGMLKKYDDFSNILEEIEKIK